MYVEFIFLLLLFPYKAEGDTRSFFLWDLIASYVGHIELIIHLCTDKLFFSFHFLHIAAYNTYILLCIYVIVKINEIEIEIYVLYYTIVVSSLPYKLTLRKNCLYRQVSWINTKKRQWIF